MPLLIKGGHVVDVTENIIHHGVDLAIKNGKIDTIGKNLSVPEATIIDATGTFVCPGFIDMHVHLREPGFEYKETIESGGNAAAAGGFTAIACMPNTRPVIDNSALVTFVKEQAKKTPVHVYPVAAISVGSKGSDMTEVGDLVAAGAVAISDDGRPVSNSYIMRRAMEYAKMFNIPVLSHCEDPWLSKGGVMNEGYTATVLGLKGIPNQAESTMAMRDIALSELTGAHIHIQHVSAKETVEVIRHAKSKGIHVTAETTPHYITLTDADVTLTHTDTKVNPPIRSTADRTAIIEGLLDGTLDAIITDHAPHSPEEKDLEFNRAPFGINGLETAIGLVWDTLCKQANDTRILTVVKACTINPANILNLDSGTLKPGAVADITIIDPNKTWTVDKYKLVSKSQNTPFHGKTLTGKATYTIIGGKVVYS